MFLNKHFEHVQTDATGAEKLLAQTRSDLKKVFSQILRNGQAQELFSILSKQHYIYGWALENF